MGGWSMAENDLFGLGKDMYTYYRGASCTTRRLPQSEGNVCGLTDPEGITQGDRPCWLFSESSGSHDDH